MVFLVSIVFTSSLSTLHRCKGGGKFYMLMVSLVDVPPSFFTSTSTHTGAHGLIRKCRGRRFGSIVGSEHKHRGACLDYYNVIIIIIIIINYKNDNDYIIIIITNNNNDNNLKTNTKVPAWIIIILLSLLLSLLIIILIIIIWTQTPRCLLPSASQTKSTASTRWTDFNLFLFLTGHLLFIRHGTS